MHKVVSYISKAVELNLQEYTWEKVKKERMKELFLLQEFEAGEIKKNYRV